MSRKHIHPLRNARNGRDLTIEQLAEEVKLGAKTIWSAEHYRPISAESRHRLCEYFGMTSLELGLVVDNGTPLPAKVPGIFEQVSLENVDNMLLSRRTFVVGTALFPLALTYGQDNKKDIPQEAIAHLDALTHQYRDLQRKGVSSLESSLRGHIATIQKKAYERLIKLNLRDLSENRHASAFYDIARACVAFGELAMAEDYAVQSIEKAVATNRRYIIPRFVSLAKAIRRKDQHEPHANAIFERACMALEQS